MQNTDSNFLVQSCVLADLNHEFFNCCSCFTVHLAFIPDFSVEVIVVPFRDTVIDFTVSLFCCCDFDFAFAWLLCK